MLTKDELKKYTALRRECAQLECRIAELRDQASCVGSPSEAKVRVQSSGKGKAPFEEAVFALIDLEALYQERLAQLLKEQMAIELAIGSLEDPTERALMRFRYLEGLTWEEVAVKISYSWQHTHRLHADALKHLQEV